MNGDGCGGKEYRISTWRMKMRWSGNGGKHEVVVDHGRLI